MFHVKSQNGAKTTKLRKNVTSRRPKKIERARVGLKICFGFFVAVRVDIMAQITDVCAAGGADGPYELILEYVGGRMPGGPPRSQAERTNGCGAGWSCAACGLPPGGNTSARNEVTRKTQPRDLHEKIM